MEFLYKAQNGKIEYAASSVFIEPMFAHDYYEFLILKQPQMCSYGSCQGLFNVTVSAIP